ncbi:transposase IS200-family protein [Crinalium epipsammum PCC 9333]|uniref:Transposase IS200-family protein n=1 Tax=Crinalium epipsammum PCC 9333 TaxID=1173022 RepID=K9VVX4_9CYAN|nr:IS200/IS605 family transposase [Crinalium epipsammum]AFZ12106.1 transposase IS200-family protein [Crinalium epipsammum PCC 9333]
MPTNLNSYRHYVYRINLHIVVVTKYRRKVITSEILTRMEEIFSRICLGQKSKLIEFGGESDHVHLLIDIYPDVAPSKLVNSLKTVSSRLIRKEFAEHINKFYWKPVFWTGAYCVISAGGAPLEILKSYIQN